MEVNKKLLRIVEDRKKAIETGISDLKKSLEASDTDTEEVKKKTQDLIQVSMKLGEAVYKSQQKDPTSNPDDQGTKKENKEDVVDADFEDVKDDKDDKDDKEKSA